MTQEQLGEKANLNYKYLSAIERGDKEYQDRQPLKNCGCFGREAL
jgi:hypothetical protein